MGQLEDMRIFVRIVEAGGVGKAADQLGMAKSGVSRSLAALENRLGVQLINRTTRRISLSGAGRDYYQAAVRIIGDISELDTLTSNEETTLQGQLRVAVPLSFGLCHLSAAINDFIRENPGLTFNIDFSDRLVNLVEQGMDLAIRITALKDSSLKARRICPIQLKLCASPAYLEKHGTPSAPEDLKRHAMLAYNIGSGTTLKLVDGQANEQVVQTTSRMVANNGDFLHDMAVSGHGIVLLPTFIAWRSLATGDLVTVLPSFPPAPLSAWAVYPQTRYLSQRARAFIDFLIERFGDNPYWDAGW
jgi:DNA-binding transcriptional LysR family regulator